MGGGGERRGEKRAIRLICFLEWSLNVYRQNMKELEMEVNIKFKSAHSHSYKKKIGCLKRAKRRWTEK